MATILQTDFSAFGAGNIGALSKSILEDIDTTMWVHDGASSTNGIAVKEIKGASDNIQKLEINGFDCLQLTIPANGSPCCFNNGSQINITLPSEENEIWGKYQFKMITPFTAGKGGVIPVWLGSNVSPFKRVKHNDNNFSATLAWHNNYNLDHSDENSIKNNSIPSSRYELKVLSFSNKQEKFKKNPIGDSRFLKNLSTNVRNLYQSNIWYEVVFRYVLNDPGVNNGIIQIWINNVLVQSVSDYNWRNDSTDGFKKLMLQFFPLGSDPSWEIGTDRKIAIRDITLADTSLLSSKTSLNNVTGFSVDCGANGYNSLTLNWSSVDSDSTDTVIERSKDGTTWSELTTVDKSILSYVDSSVEVNSLYFYRIKSKDTGLTYSDSRYSNVVNCSTLNQAPIVIPPTNLVASAIDASSILISWNYSDPSDQVEIIIQQSSDGILFTEIGRMLASSERKSWKAIELNDGTQYFFRIYAQRKDSLVQSFAVGPAFATTPIYTTPPGSPCTLQYFTISSGWVPINSSGVVNLTLSNEDASNLKFRYNCANIIYDYLPVDWQKPIANDINIDIDSISEIIDLTKYHNTNDDIISDPNSIRNIKIVNEPVFGTYEIENNTIIYIPNPNFDGLDSLSYTYENLFGNESNIGVIYLHVENPYQGTSVLNINNISADSISLDFSNSHFGDGTPTGSTSGYHQLILTLENEDDRPYVELNKTIGQSFSQTEINEFEAIGLTNLSGVFTGTINYLVKNVNEEDHLAYPISIQHRYGKTSTGYFANISNDEIPTFGILAWDDESQAVNQAAVNEVLETPTLLGGGITLVTSTLSEIYDVDRYSLAYPQCCGTPPGGNWVVRSYNLPCIPKIDLMYEPLSITGDTTLGEAIMMFVASKINTNFKYANSDGFLNLVTHRNQLYYTNDFIANCGNYEDEYYIEIQDEFENYFRISMTINQIRKR